MTLERTLRQQLSEPGTGEFHVSNGGWEVSVHADNQDSLSCALKQLALNKNAPIGEELDAWAKRVAENATGLLEPLCVLEVDRPIGKAVLRSETPSVRDGKAFYYELVLTRAERTTAILRRYTGDRVGGDKRERVPFVLTHDAIVKLVTDIVGAN